MNIPKEIKENYEIAKSKGFYPDDSKIEDHLMGIVSELGEAYEAHRGGKFAKYSLYTLDELIKGFKESYTHKPLFMQYYVQGVKSSFEDEIADVFIRLFNLCGHKNWDLDLKLYDWNKYDIVKGLYDCVSDLNYGYDLETCNDLGLNISKCGSRLLSICSNHNIPIEKHIQAKKEYNKTRPHLHGKKY